MNFSVIARIAGGVAIVALFFFGTLYVLDYSAPARIEARSEARVDGVLLKPPFRPAEGSKFAVVAPADGMNDLSDAPNAPERSPFVIYENDKKLGPAHSSYNAVATVGKGQFIHWINNGFIFTASDNSDPNTNGRTYRIVKVR
jgi:hypothetical protein